ncbi:hypothetical protein BBAD15_g8750 [Beauveria bassiana D1-5]|uniref:Uncharacterized protein n=1 Tax=Beauveria bassiana D1-5 TaxID=1245745 RepID=A0A0A2VZ15_BEABA|nr:hypothetical protein BBAD15_g8750 [Beauveria bassiana D1-5]
MSSDMHHDSTLEAGLLRKQQQEEEKSQLSARSFGDRTPGIPDTCPGQQESRKMSPLRRFLVIALIGLVALMGLAAAGGSCPGAMQHRAVQLDKRQAPGSNTTTPPTNQGNEGNQQTTGGVTQTISNTVTETAVTTETVHQPTSGSNPTGSSSTGTSEPGSSPPASSPPSSSAPPPPPPSSTPSSPATPSNPTTSVPTSQAPPASTPTASPSTPAPVPSSGTSPTASTTEVASSSNPQTTFSSVYFFFFGAAVDFGSSTSIFSIIFFISSCSTTFSKCFGFSLYWNYSFVGTVYQSIASGDWFLRFTPPSRTPESTTSSPETTPRRTITTGTVTTSSAVQETITRTNGDGGIEIITSTSWVEIRPSSTDKADPSLQNVANSRGAGSVAAAAIAGVVAGAMML